MAEQTYKLTIEKLLKSSENKQKNLAVHEMNNLTLRKLFHPLIRFKKLSFLASSVQICLYNAILR